MTFASLGLDPLILSALESSGYTEPTQVQREAIPAALAGEDLLVSSQTGSGKTAAFIVPALHRLLKPAAVQGMGPRILVLTPTRELAQQVERAALTYGQGIRRLRSANVVGGASYTGQLRRLSQPVDLVVATPGRLIDHLERGRIDFSRLEVLVLDEADRMLDMGFIEDIENIVRRTPETRQTLLFSATLDGVVGSLARRLTRNPRRIEVQAAKTDIPMIDQRMLFADDFSHKGRLLDHLLRDVDIQQAVVFTATKRSAEDLSENLREQGFSAAALHGDMPQIMRNRTLDRLRDGRTRVLVATDVAARGIDVVGISHVINYDAPRQAEDYVHRIGRTGRAGRNGVAVTLVGHRERGLIREIERYTGQEVRVEVIPGLEPVARPERPRSPGGRPGWKPGGKPGGFGARAGAGGAGKGWSGGFRDGGKSGGGGRPGGGKPRSGHGH